MSTEQVLKILKNFTGDLTPVNLVLYLMMQEELTWVTMGKAPTWKQDDIVKLIFPKLLGE